LDKRSFIDYYKSVVPFRNPNAIAISDFLRFELGIDGTKNVFEVGCGIGDLIKNIGAGVADGCDVNNDKFLKLEANYLKDVKSDFYDVVFAYSVFQYFPDFCYASKAIDEMFRICKDDGIVFIGDVPDIDLMFDFFDFTGRDIKKFDNDSRRPMPLFYSKSFFRRFGSCIIVNNKNFCNDSRFRFNVKYVNGRYRKK